MVVKLFDELGPRYAARNGGYLRILKYGFRKGDNAPMALVELVDRPDRQEGGDEGGSDRKSRRRSEETENRRRPEALQIGTGKPAFEPAFFLVRARSSPPPESNPARGWCARSPGRGSNPNYGTNSS